MMGRQLTGIKEALGQLQVKDHLDLKEQKGGKLVMTLELKRRK